MQVDVNKFCIRICKNFCETKVNAEFTNKIQLELSQKNVVHHRKLIYSSTE